MTEFEARLAPLVARQDEEWRARHQVHVDAVIAAGASSIADLIQILLDQSAGEVRWNASKILGEIEGDQVTAAYLALLRDPEVNRRNEASSMLAQRGEAAEQVVPALIAMMQTDPSDFLRGGAALSLGSFVEHIDALEILLATVADLTTPAYLRGCAAEALSGFEDPRVTPALLVALTDPSPRVRYDAAFALGARSDPDTIPALERVAASDFAEVESLGTVAAEAQSALNGIRYTIAWNARQPEDDEDGEDDD